MTTANALRAHTSAVLLARAAYYQENHCRCGRFVGRIQSRQQPRCADCARQKAKNNRIRRAA